MSDLNYFLVKDNVQRVVTLTQLSVSTTTDITHGDTNTNQARQNAVALLQKSQEQLKTTLSVSPEIILVYRSVAGGGVTRYPSNFVAKPLTHKAKSIDPTLINDAEFSRLSGLLPCNSIISKSRKDEEIKDVKCKLKCMRVDTSVGDEKSYLHYDTAHEKLVWLSSPDSGSNSMVVEFCANGSGKPYLADWDLVSVAVKKSSINVISKAVNQEELKPLLFLAEAPAESLSSPEDATGICPVWLSKAINALRDVSTSVTRHGPESLYCGNDITRDGIVVFSSQDLKEAIGKESKISEQTDTHQYHFDLMGYFSAQSLLAEQWFFYNFTQFNGKNNNLSAETKSDEANKLNGKIRELFPEPKIGLGVHH